MSKGLHATKCRACMFPLNAAQNIVPIFKEYKSSTLLAHMISETIHITPDTNDNLGENVCKLCAEKIYAFYEFRLSYLESQKKLHEMLLNFEKNQRTNDANECIPVTNVAHLHSIDATGRLQCNECGRCFNRELELRIHLHTHRNCETPPQLIEQQNGFDEQLLIANIKSEPVEYELDPLDWAEVTQNDNETGKIQNGDEMRWKCTICHSRFLRRAHLRAHRREHAIDRPIKFHNDKKDDKKTIPIIKYEDINLKLSINDSNNSSDAERWQCKKCFITFRTRRLLRDHNVIHRNSSATSIDQDFQVNSTAETSASSLLLPNDESFKIPTKKSHTSPKSHSTPLKSESRWKCSKCRKTFDTPKALRKHKLSNHTFEIKLNFKSKNFVSDPNKSSLDLTPKKRSFNRSAFVERDWPCNSCHQVFNRRSILRDHRRTAHILKPTDLPCKEELDGYVAQEHLVA